MIAGRAWGHIVTDIFEASELHPRSAVRMGSDWYRASFENPDAMWGSWEGGRVST